MPERIVIGTRGSKLALIQTEMVRELLENEGYEVEIRIIKTRGDLFTDKPLHEFKGVGAFVREIDAMVSRGEIDIAVHSLKDVPTKSSGNTVIAAVLPRDSPFDVFISPHGDVDSIKDGAVVGTSSMRRSAQLRRYRSDLEIKSIRGNVDTRLRKLKDGEYDAVILAEAGLKRLNLEVDYSVLDPEHFVPSANQGIIAVVTREGREDTVSWMNDKETFIEGMVEREIIREIGAGCIVPVGVFARLKGNKIKVTAEILSADGNTTIRVEETINRDEYIIEARKIGRELKKRGGSRLIERAFSR